MSLSLQRAVSVVIAAGYLIASLIVYQHLSLKAGIGMFSMTNHTTFLARQSAAN